MESYSAYAFQVAETSAALMDAIAGTKRLHDAFYEARKDLDGMVGMWTSCAFVALAAQETLAPLWSEQKRDFIEDVDRLGSFMVYWQTENHPIEYLKDAKSIVSGFLTYYPNGQHS